MERHVGVINKMEPLMVNGVHATWENDRGMTYYKFTVTIGDLSGTILSSKQSPTWKIGTKVDVAVKRGNNRVSFSDLKMVTEDDKPKSSIRYYSPEGVRESAMGMAQRIARMAFEGILKLHPEKEIPSDLNSITSYAKFYFDWIIADGMGRDQCGIRWYALEEAVANIQFKNLNISSKEKIIETAETLLKQVKEVNNVEKPDLL